MKSRCAEVVGMLSRDQKYMLAFGAIALLAVLSFSAVNSFKSTMDHDAKNDPQIVSLRDYVAKNFADPDAEITEVSTPVRWHEQTWRSMNLRHVNAMGGRIFSIYAVHYEGDDVWEIKKFDDLILKAATREISDDVAAFIDTLDRVRKIDVRMKKAAH